MKRSWPDGGGNAAATADAEQTVTRERTEAGQSGRAEILGRVRFQPTKIITGESAQKMTGRFILSPAIRVFKISPTVGFISCPEHFCRRTGSDQTEMTSSKAPRNLGSEPSVRKLVANSEGGGGTGKLRGRDVLPHPLDGGQDLPSDVWPGRRGTVPTPPLCEAQAPSTRERTSRVLVTPPSSPWKVAPFGDETLR